MEAAAIAVEAGTTASLTYDAWGNILTATGELAEINPLRYRGYYYDSETGLYYLQSRYYDPANRRFINADGYASTGQGFTGTNMFVYCLNNPVQRTDSGGTASWHYAVTLRNEGPTYDVNNPSPKSIAMREQVGQILDNAEYSEAAWEALDCEGRKALLNQLTGELTAVMGIQINQIAYIDDYPGYDGSFAAFYDDINNDVCFMPVVYIKMPYSMVTTLVHELYHAYQHAAVAAADNLGEPYTLVLLWKVNQQDGNYISPTDNRILYYNQPVEIREPLI